MWVRTAAEVSAGPLQFTVPTEPSRLCISSFFHWAVTLSGFSACEVQKLSDRRPREEAKGEGGLGRNAHLLRGRPAMFNRRILTFLEDAFFSFSRCLTRARETSSPSRVKF